MKFSDTIVRLLYPFLVADMEMQLLQVTFSASLWYVDKARDVLASIVFGLQLFVNTACLFHLYQAGGNCRCVIF